jgi:hypothetical protein
LKLKHDKQVSNVSFNCNLRHYTVDPTVAERLQAIITKTPKAVALKASDMDEDVPAAVEAGGFLRGGFLRASTHGGQGESLVPPYTHASVSSPIENMHSIDIESCTTITSSARHSL